jgi:hypothetical protein
VKKPANSRSAKTVGSAPGRIVELTSPAQARLKEDPRWLLVERVVASTPFQRTQRLREFLLYVAERAILDPGAGLHEQEIGHAVFGRPADYDTSQDNLVRVQASKLRKRLQEYFATEGKDEAEVVELPKGSYLPRFLPRVLPEREAAEMAKARQPRFVLLAPFLALLILLGGLSVWLWRENADLKRRAGPPVESRPVVESFWNQLFAGTSSPHVILSDANLTIFQDLLGRNLRLGEYRHWKRFGEVTDVLEDSPDTKRTAENVISHHFVALGELDALRSIEEAGRTAGVWPEPRFARLVSTQQVREGNVVLLGNSRVNPWVGLFDEERQFRFEFDGEDGTPSARFRIDEPRPGERDLYRVRWNAVSYCAVAFLPRHNSPGNVLIIEGADIAGSAAGAALLTSERWMRELSGTLGREAGEWPAFEVLLESQLVERRPDRFSIVAHRVNAE